MRHLFKKVSSGAGRVWCRTLHPAPMWPIHNHYICPSCQRKWPVLWLKDEPKQESKQEPRRVHQLQPVERSL